MIKIKIVLCALIFCMPLVSQENSHISCTKDIDIYLTYTCDDYDDDKDGDRSFYDALCDRMEEKPLSYWQLLLRKGCAQLFVAYLKMKKMFHHCCRTKKKQQYRPSKNHA